MEDKHGLKNLRVGYANLPPFVIAKTVNGTDVFDGFMPAIIQRVFQAMNMNLIFKREPEDKYGTFENNTWTGMAGMLYKGEVDMLMNPLIPKPAFYEFAFISNPVTIEAFTILSGKEVEEAGLFLYFSVLDKWVWAGMAITLLVVAFTSVFLFKEAMMTSALKKMKLFNEYCWLFFAYMMRESTNEKWLLRENKSLISIFISIIATSWAIGIGFLVMNTFQSLLVSKLTLKKAKPIADTMMDFVKRKSTIGIAPKEIMLEDILANSSIPVYEKAWEKIAPNLLPASEVFQNQVLLDVEAGKYCIFHGHLILKNVLRGFFQKRTTCNFHLSEKYFYPFSLPIIMSNKLPRSFHEEFNTRFTRLVDADISGKWLKADQQIVSLCTSYSENDLSALGLQHIYGVLLLWAAGLFISFIALICEIMHKRQDVKLQNTLS